MPLEIIALIAKPHLLLAVLLLGVVAGMAGMKLRSEM
jgi:hypothetical protein